MDESLNSEDEDTFLGAAMLVLIDFPNYVIISAYMLVAVVWAEAFLQSRRHWMSNYDYRQKWLMGYLIFNTCLYSVQLCLYSLIFLPNINLSLLSSLLYGAMTVINILLPSTWFALYVYLSIKFAGFPPSSLSAMNRLRALTKLGVVWTVSRLIWGAISLTEVTDNWLFDNGTSIVLLSVELLVVFLLVEVVPIWLSLKPEYLQALVTNDSNVITESNRDESASMGTNTTDSGTLYRDINKGYSFDGDDDLRRIIFTDSMDSRRHSSNESSSPVLRGSEVSSIVGDSDIRSSDYMTARGSGAVGSNRGTIASRGTTHSSNASMAESCASEEEYAPSGARAGWFNW
eukprot:CAMPEP_0114414202 /NCGR_PEP_ID=MMETSP0103-20121206/1262_1 /TAXON_ID=37642 ORGANISM="Paraphysomonas imperforata, Strain PA2" /NCGR_SAMPLE_ID=MMETSP0103 /ASSEMBLY_ACC=CAM_ASM_000201 /LENGTH=344 /DNA_ID=CAMNT_0001582327 /DNA_START=224 /DNA_END=1255 /DNA_ORIENTATION=+